MKLNKMNVMDWVECCPTDDRPLYVEQKARFIDTAKAKYYNTLMIGKNKIDFFRDNINQCRGRIYFDLTDGLFFIDYNKDTFDKYFVEKFQREGRDCDDKECDVVHIPFKHLSRVSVQP